MLKKILFFTIICLFITSCQAFKPEKVDTRERSTNAQERARKNRGMGESTDLFDIVKGHLIDEGLTEEEALKKMLTLTDEERSEIIEGSCGSKKDKKKKGGYGK